MRGARAGCGPPDATSASCACGPPCRSRRAAPRDFSGHARAALRARGRHRVLHASHRADARAARARQAPPGERAERQARRRARRRTPRREPRARQRRGRARARAPLSGPGLLLLGLAQPAQRLLLLPYLRLGPEGLVELLLTTFRLLLQRALRGIHARLGVALTARRGHAGVECAAPRPAGTRSPPAGLHRDRLAAALRRGDSQLAHRFPPQGDLARRDRLRPALAVQATQVRRTTAPSPDR